MYTNGRNLKRTKGTKEFDYEAWKKIILWKGKEEMAQLTMKKGKKSKLKGKLSKMKKGKGWDKKERNMKKKKRWDQ